MPLYVVFSYRHKCLSGLKDLIVKKKCNSLNSPGCSSYSNSRNSPLSQHIHIIDGYIKTFKK